MDTFTLYLMYIQNKNINGFISQAYILHVYYNRICKENKFKAKYRSVQNTVIFNIYIILYILVVYCIHFRIRQDLNSNGYIPLADLNWKYLLKVSYFK